MGADSSRSRKDKCALPAERSINTTATSPKMACAQSTTVNPRHTPRHNSGPRFTRQSCRKTAAKGIAADRPSAASGKITLADRGMRIGPGRNANAEIRSEEDRGGKEGGRK